MPAQASSFDFLLVEDDLVFAQVLVRALQKRGYSTQCAHTAAQALQHASSNQFRYAVVDLKLGEDSGLLLIQELKQRQASIELIMLTGYSSISTAVDAIKLGAINYLCKPADADEILAALKICQTTSLHSASDYTPLSVGRLEWEHIQKVLQDNQGNISATARALGMHRRTLQRKLQKRPAKQ